MKYQKYYKLVFDDSIDVVCYKKCIVCVEVGEGTIRFEISIELLYSIKIIFKATEYQHRF